MEVTMEPYWGKADEMCRNMFGWWCVGEASWSFEAFLLFGPKNIQSFEPAISQRTATSGGRLKSRRRSWNIGTTSCFSLMSSIKLWTDCVPVNLLMFIDTNEWIHHHYTVTWMSVVSCSFGESVQVFSLNETDGNKYADTLTNNTLKHMKLNLNMTEYKESRVCACSFQISRI